MNNCTFCTNKKYKIIAENELAFAALDKFPVN